MRLQYNEGPHKTAHLCLKHCSFLPLARILYPLPKGVASTLHTVREALKAVANGLGASRIVDGLANTPTCGSDHASDGLGETAREVADLLKLLE